MIELSHQNLQDAVKREQQGGHVVVFTNGVFDLVHVGHLRYLEEARALGDVLVVGVNSDACVRRLKGEKRPIVPESERAELIAGFRCVQYVTIFDTPTPVPLVQLLKPDIYAKGGDYSFEQLPEAQVVQNYGGRVALLSHFAGHSSTDVITVIRDRYIK